MLLLSLSEVNTIGGEMDVNSKNSMPFAVILLLIYLTYYVFTIVYFVRYRNVKDSSKFKYSSEVFAELSVSTEARLHPILFLTRRLLFVGLLVLLTSIGSIATLSVMCGIQMLYMVMLLGMKPHKERVNNVVELINELAYLGYLAWHFNFNSRAKWTKVAINAFICAVIFNNVIVLIALVGKQDLHI